MCADIVIVCAAGWKPMGSMVAPPGTFGSRLPDALYPVGDKDTVISRLVRQLRYVFRPERFIVGVGDPETCSYAERERVILKDRGLSLPGEGSPWTWGRVGAIRSLGVDVHLQEHPAKGRFLTTLRAILGKLLLEDDWATIFVSAGDYVMNTTYLRVLASEAEYPCAVWFKPCHPIFFLDREGAERLMKAEHDGNRAMWHEREQNFETNIHLFDLDIPERAGIPLRNVFCEVEPHDIGTSLLWADWVASRDTELPDVED